MDSKGGKPFYRSDPSLQLNLEGYFDLVHLHEVYVAAEQGEEEARIAATRFDNITNDEVDDEEGEDEEIEQQDEDGVDDESLLMLPSSMRMEPSIEPTLDDASAKLIPFVQLKQFIESTCCCKTCHLEIELTQSTFVLATNLCIQCSSKKDED